MWTFNTVNLKMILKDFSNKMFYELKAIFFSYETYNKNSMRLLERSNALKS